MRATELFESAASELAKKLPSLEKHDYNTIDKLMRKIASKHRITGKALHDLFVKEYHKTPDTWIKGKLDEGDQKDLNQDPVVQKFIKFAAHTLKLEKTPKIEFGCIVIKET